MRCANLASARLSRVQEPLTDQGKSSDMVPVVRGQKRVKTQDVMAAYCSSVIDHEEDIPKMYCTLYHAIDTVGLTRRSLCPFRSGHFAGLL